MQANDGACEGLNECIISRGEYCDCNDGRCCCTIPLGAYIEEWVCTKDDKPTNDNRDHCYQEPYDTCTHFNVCGKDCFTKMVLHHGPATVCLDDSRLLQPQWDDNSWWNSHIH